jgi:hypothetical protein
VALATCAGLAACVPETDNLQGEVYEVCYRELAGDVQRDSATTASASLVVEEIDLGDAALDDPTVGLANARVRAAGEVDLGFVDAARVEVAGMPVLALAGGGDELYGERSDGPNLFGYLQGDALPFAIEVDGDIPAARIAILVDACFAVDGVTVAY